MFDLSVPRVTPARVNGGGGGRSELVITWEVNMHLHTLHDFFSVFESEVLNMFSFICNIKINTYSTGQKSGLLILPSDSAE